MIRPETESDLAEAVAAATSPLRISGGGTRSVGAPVNGELLSIAGLSGITLYEPGALTMVARAGTPLAEIRDALAAENQRLAFEPMDHCGLMGTEGVSTIGGVVAANISGPRRVQVGACRDFMLGVRFVDGAGNILKNGGRVMKNVTGYDLVKLMCGSHGTLGALSEVSFKVLPKVETAATVLIEGLSDRDAVKAMSAVLGSPYEVSGAAHVRPDPGAVPVTMLRLEGFAESVRYRTGKVQALLAAFGEGRVEAGEQEVAALWSGVQNVDSFHGRAGDVWRISVKPSDGPVVGGQLAAADPKAEVMYDWGGGLIWALVAPGTDVRAQLGGIRGHATLTRGSAQAHARFGTFQPEPAPLAQISRALRAKFDPRGIMNTGLMG